ncbi:methyl-accepting chemotaxis protein [uncultured Roseovarius sp.]|uniref:methyl-accepting chemotaxis protein n=1 Tax=uncultured Roseovarius sp. TaxID=293344 RepID=UPI00261CC6FE|nr:methyl-accepting chemotaxis protein [uncultured Roseovarius sp.]
MARKKLDQNSPLIGRFDQSFLIHMIRDFFVILIAVTVLEFTLKAGLVYYSFRVSGPERTQQVAEDIADNVRSIMRNEGGPVAARTVYPILKRNWSDLGYRIAITPTPVTIRSIDAGFGFAPEGIPQGDWPDATHNLGHVPITAEPFCLACHTAADVGDVLGEVIVRRDLATDFTQWAEDMRLTGLLSLGKIVLHSFLLFLILRARLEPLLGLRAVVSNLARAYGGLTHRAEIRTADEFGVLARDLNLFLDRVCRLMEELDEVLARVVSVNADIVKIQSDLRDRIDSLTGRIRRLERSAMLSAKAEPRLSQAWFDAARRAVADLETRRADPREEDIGSIVEDLRAVVTNAEAQIETSERVFADLGELGDESEKLKRAMAEMIRLEERMEGIVETGSMLVQRIRPADSPE